MISVQEMISVADVDDHQDSVVPAGVRGAEVRVMFHPRVKGKRLM